MYTSYSVGDNEYGYTKFPQLTEEQATSEIMFQSLKDDGLQRLQELRDLPELDEHKQSVSSSSSISGDDSCIINTAEQVVGN